MAAKIKLVLFVIAILVGSALLVEGQSSMQRARTTASGNQLFIPDNTYDIGASGATRPKNVFIANTMSTATANTNVLELNAVVFASLGTPSNGTFRYCSDCTIASPCAGAGTGSFAKRLNGVWVCN